MIALVAMRPPERIADYPFIVDLQEVCSTSLGQATIRLWEDGGGELMGFTLLEGSYFTFEISPHAAFEILAGEMIAWAVEKLASTGKSPDFPVELETACLEENTQRCTVLERLGFVVQPVRTLHFRRSLKGPIRTPNLPDGFLIRPTAGEEEAEAWVALHRAAHGTENMTVDFRLAMMRTPEYDPTLDLVAVSPEGRLAAYVVCHFSPQENYLRKQRIGYTDPVATHPDFQRKGVARALLLAGFGRLMERGMDFVEVSTWGENIGMIKTAESVGFRRYSTTIFFNRPLPYNRDPA